MAASTRILLNHNLKRSFSSTMGNLSKYAHREARFMKKMLMGDSGKRTWHVNKNRPAFSPVGVEKLTSTHVTRRMTVLNKIFMGHITDLMATGEASKKLLGRNIEVTGVKMTQNFKNIRVYWMMKANDKDNDTEKVLNDCAFALRHELTQLRVIGQVPMILFVKDKQIAHLDELDRRLKNADYGEDHDPVVTPYVPKQALTLETTLSPEVRAKILKLEAEESANNSDIEDEDELCDEYDVDLPPMRHDVLGLDHYAIMSRLKLALNKCQDGPKNRLNNVFTILPSEMSIPAVSPTFRSTKEDRAAFVTFLNARRREQRRMDRMEKREKLSSANFDEENDENIDDYEFFKDEEDIDVIEDISLDLPK